MDTGVIRALGVEVAQQCDAGSEAERGHHDVGVLHLPGEHLGNRPEVVGGAAQSQVGEGVVGVELLDGPLGVDRRHDRGDPEHLPHRHLADPALVDRVGHLLRLDAARQVEHDRGVRSAAGQLEQGGQDRLAQRARRTGVGELDHVAAQYAARVANRPRDQAVAHRGEVVLDDDAGPRRRREQSRDDIATDLLVQAGNDRDR